MAESTPGTYQLLIYLPCQREIQVGRLGSFRFPQGYYVYTGSAMGGLETRIARHLRREKRFHWHIDYLLEHARIVKFYTSPGNERQECLLASEFINRPQIAIPAQRFGSSDCRCPSHLVYLGCEMPEFCGKGWHVVVEDGKVEV